MAYKPTGRPVGRPKTKDYKTISLKIPQDLLDRVQRYAGLHRQSISELIRDGLEWRITEGDPRWQPMSDNRYSGNTELQELAQPVHLTDEGMPFDEDLAVVPAVTGQPEQGPQYSNTVLPEEAPAFDPTKYALGELCTHGHEYHGTGQSLRRLSDKECLECQAARARAARQRKSQAQPGKRQATPAGSVTRKG